MVSPRYAVQKGLRQLFSTVVYSWDGNLSAEVLFLPRADLLKAEDVQDVPSTLQSLDATLLAPFQSNDPTRALATFFAAVQGGGSDLQTWQQEIAKGHIKSLEPNHNHWSFARELLESSRIPFEESPLMGVTLEQLIAKASPTGLGALIGWVLAGNTPLLLISIPVGIIIVQSAVGVGRGLEEGLHARIKRLFTGRR